MNLLREYISELLTEAAKAPQDLPKNVVVHIQAPAQSGGLTQIRYTDESGKNLVATSDGPWGEVYVAGLQGREYGPCGGAWKVSHSSAGRGWGPMLYDVAMEYATETAGGLIADRDAVSPEARRVWDYYLSGRSDVTTHQLDDLENTLTPEEEDNCDQKVAGFDVNRPAGGRYSSRKKADVDWVESPLSKRYTKPSTTIEALRTAGKLIWREAGDLPPMKDLDAEGPIAHLERYIRGLLIEATEHDSKFKPLMDSGYDGIKQAMELADQLGISSQELPWELKHVDEYLDKIFDPTLDDLEATGWSMEEYRAADWGGGEYENFERELGLREALHEQSMSDEAKITMLFFKESSRLGIQMAEMTPGLEELAEDMDDFRVLVIEFIGHVEGLVKDRRGDHNVVMELCQEIEKETYMMTQLLSSREAYSAARKWEDDLCSTAADAKVAYSWPSRWSPKDQAKLDDLKDWARET